MNIITKLTIGLALLTCSCSTPLSTLTDMVKPDTGITAQVGAENVKQGVGVNSSIDQSTERKTETDIKGNNNSVKNDATEGMVVKDVGHADVKAAKDSTSVGPVQADKVIINNGSGNTVAWFSVGIVALILLFVFGLLWASLGRLKSKVGDKVG